MYVTSIVLPPDRGRHSIDPTCPVPPLCMRSPHACSPTIFQAFFTLSHGTVECPLQSLPGSRGLTCILSLAFSKLFIPPQHSTWHSEWPHILCVVLPLSYPVLEADLRPPHPLTFLLDHPSHEHPGQPLGAPACLQHIMQGWLLSHFFPP